MRRYRVVPFHPVAVLLGLAALVAGLPAHALYKVVGPDGKVTYTDRIPGPTDGKVTPLSPKGNTVTDTAALPLELRQAAQRYPVTLFVVADCSPCDNARALLRQRGIPHAEKLVLTEEDAEALQRLTGARDAPTLTIGQQALRGLSSDTWNAYLDAAGYPRESRLPPGYQFADPTTLTQRREPPRPATAPPPIDADATEPAPPAVANRPGSIRF
jgi:glutaredoxin